jgi:predicted dehydrogenase
MPEAVFADLTIIRPISSVQDYMELILYYSGCRVRIKGSYLVREAIPAYVLHGSAGSFLKTRADPQEEKLQAGARPGGDDWGIEAVDQEGLLHTEREGKVIRERVRSLRGNYREYYDGIYAAIREGGPLPVSSEDGINILRVIEAAYQSNEEKKIVSL